MNPNVPGMLAAIMALLCVFLTVLLSEDLKQVTRWGYVAAFFILYGMFYVFLRVVLI